jgi:hypothetical protein
MSECQAQGRVHSCSKPLTWPLKGLVASAGVAAVLLVLAAPPAAAHNGDPARRTNSDNSRHHHRHHYRHRHHHHHYRECKGIRGRDLSSAVVDYSNSDNLAGTEFRVMTDRKGRAYFNDSRDAGDWINLAVVHHAPHCVVDSTLGYTEDDAAPANQLYVDLLTQRGAVYEAVCTIHDDNNAFNVTNLAAYCGTGFTKVPGTPMDRH